MANPTAEKETRDLAITWLYSLAERYPKQRLMQIIFNALDGVGLAKHPHGGPRDVFYVSDEQLKEALRKAVNGGDLRS